MTDQVWIWTLATLGIFLLILEIFLPGAIVGTIGVICIIIATYIAAQEYGTLYAGLLFLGSTALCALAFYIFFRSPARKLMILEDQLGPDLQESDLSPGLQGTSLSPLRPSGRALFVLSGREKQVDVSANGEFIEQDQLIRISKIEGSRVFVDKV